MIFSEASLRLQPRWFTGKQWADGTAECELQHEYSQACRVMEAVELSKTPAQKARDRAERKKRKFQKWFEWSMRNQ